MKQITITMDDDGKIDLVETDLILLDILWMLESALSAFKFTYMSRNPDYLSLHTKEARENYGKDK